MRYLTTREEMQNIDRYSIEEIGIPGLVLMEKAAMSMEEEILRRFPEKASVLIVVERGNNGGDGLALGRMLHAKGYDVDLYEIGGVPKESDSYKVQRKILENLGIGILSLIPEKSYDIIVDAIFGVGLKREVTGIQKEVIERLNQAEAYKIAVDLPSGVDAGTGKILGIAFEADLTITFGLSKIGLVLYPGASKCGEICVKDIGFPQISVDKIAPSAYTYDWGDFHGIPDRKPWSNKGTYGKVLMVAGTKNMAGAACLAGEAAYRSGSGLVRVFTCEENRIILQNQLPEAILTTYEKEEDCLSLLKEALSWASVIGFGPGLSTADLTAKMLRLVLKEGKCPLVLDADGINVLARLRKDEPEVWEDALAYPHGMILTPHLMEMSRLCGKSVAEIKNSLIETAKELADQTHIIVLKDARTVVADGSDKVYINTNGNHGMSVGGSGDVLTGIVCGLLAGGAELSEAARSGVFCHGAAGDAAAEKTGYYALLARDIIEGLKNILKK
ncbi:MAG: NAD(P)H-hydrate dehydratase [Eubacteriales bacterium]|nr:NAD(P)H-hydrate dehydratase [Eubacteriales bacterium]